MSTTTVTAQREPAEALRQLCTLCPDFERWWNDEEVEDRLVDGVHAELTHHHLAMEFLDYCAGNHATLNEQQLRAIGAWLSDAVAHDDALGDAPREEDGLVLAPDLVGSPVELDLGGERQRETRRDDHGDPRGERATLGETAFERAHDPVVIGRKRLR